MTQAHAKGSDTRKANMELRRLKILETARKIIAEQGFNTLNLRDLAESAGVTVPTIYNLIGNKAELVQCLFEESMTPFEPSRYVLDKSDPVAAAEKFFETVFEYLGANENYHRAEFIARWDLELAGDPGAHEVLSRIVGGAITAIKESTRAGLLRGQVPPQKLGRQMYRVLRLAYIEWARGEIGFDDFRQEVLSGTYLCLAADAHPKFHRALIHKYNTLSLGPYEVSKK